MIPSLTFYLTVGCRWIKHVNWHCDLNNREILGWCSGPSLWFPWDMFYIQGRRPLSSLIITTFIFLIVNWLFVEFVYMYGCILKFVCLSNIWRWIAPVNRDLCAGSPLHFGELHMPFIFYTTLNISAFVPELSLVWRPLVVNTWFITLLGGAQMKSDHFRMSCTVFSFLFPGTTVPTAV